MQPDEAIRPFRWDVTRRNQLGSLPAVDVEDPYPEFEEDVLATSARVLASSGDSDVVFVGRSPQPLFDLLSGLLLQTSWQGRLRLLNISLRRVVLPDQEQLRAIRPYFAEVGLEPLGLAQRSRSLALVDVVDTGDTFGALVEFVKDWGDEASVNWQAVARNIRIVGLTWREKTSPKTRRWQQHAEWVEQLRPGEIKNVSLDPRFATYLAADAPKTTPAFTPDRWGDEDVMQPGRDQEAREALALAVRLFDLGRMRSTRERFARALAREPAMKERWFRSLVLEIRR